MATKEKRRKGKKKPDEDDLQQKQLHLINLLAKRLPWISVIIILLSMLYIMLEIYIKRSS